jgi:copper chaperone CopZ
MRQMISLIAIFIVAGFLVVPSVADEKPEQVRTVFNVKGMHCDGCSSTITATLERVDGVVSAQADHEKGTAEAIYQPRKVEVEELKAEIEKLGYTVTGLKTQAVDQ